MEIKKYKTLHMSIDNMLIICNLRKSLKPMATNFLVSFDQFWS